MNPFLAGASNTSVLHRPVTRRGARGEKPPLEKFSPLLEKCVGHILKLLEIV